MSMSACAHGASGMTGESFEPRMGITKWRPRIDANLNREWTRKFHHKDTKNTENKNPQITQITQILLKVEPLPVSYRIHRYWIAIRLTPTLDPVSKPKSA
jgi:hypothetical protein